MAEWTELDQMKQSGQNGENKIEWSKQIGTRWTKRTI